MSKLHTQGRSAIAQLLKDHISNNLNAALVAYGTGETWWHSQHVEQITFDVDGIANTAYPPQQTKPVIIKDLSGGLLAGFDVSAEGVITRQSGSTIPEEATVEVTYTAHRAEHHISDQTLFNEVGRCKVTNADFVAPLLPEDDQNQATIVYQGVKYKFITEVSRLVCVRARLEAGDAIGDDIAEHGLFINCVVNSGLPDAQTFFTPDQISDQGVLLISQTTSPIPHDGSIGLDTTIIFEL